MSSCLESAKYELSNDKGLAWNHYFLPTGAPLRVNPTLFSTASLQRYSLASGHALNSLTRTLAMAALRNGGPESLLSSQISGSDVSGKFNNLVCAHAC